VEANDLSPLQPMSVQDLIWVSAAQKIKKEEAVNIDKIKIENEIKNLQSLYYEIADVKTLLFDVDYYTRLHAIKGTKVSNFKAFDINDLPGVKYSKYEEEKAEEERLQKLTPKQRVEEIVKNLKKGKKYTVR
jgi:D-hexose-6-phosphate mutarotase